MTKVTLRRVWGSSSRSAATAKAAQDLSVSACYQQLNYVAGKQEIEDLLAARAEQQGKAFDLGRFHDEFLAAGMIPVKLTQWEMVGSESIARKFSLP